MRKRGGNNNSNNLPRNGSNGSSSMAVSKLLSQQQQNNNHHPHYRDGQTVILDVREPILAGSNNNNSNNNKNNKDDNATQLNAKNHRLAKELSEVRIRHREECKNVTRLTMENMSLASRCREAITQAATMKKDLSLQKRKTAEAVAQTHILLDQLKKMKYALTVLECEKEQNTKNNKNNFSNSSGSNSEQQEQTLGSIVATDVTTLSSTGEDTADKPNTLVLADLSHEETVIRSNDDKQLHLTPPSTTGTSMSTKKQESGNSDTTEITSASTISLAPSTNDDVFDLKSSASNKVEEQKDLVKESVTDPISTNMSTSTTMKKNEGEVDVVTNKLNGRNVVDLDDSQSLDEDNTVVQINTIDHQISVEQSPLSQNDGPTCDDSDMKINNDQFETSSDVFEEKLNSSSTIKVITANLDDSDNIHQNGLSPVLGTICNEEYDDSEHKSDDNIYTTQLTDAFIVGEIDKPKASTNSSSVNHYPLISSDDYELGDNVDIDDNTSSRTKNIVDTMECQHDGTLLVTTHNCNVSQSIIIDSDKVSTSSENIDVAVPTIEPDSDVEIANDDSAVTTQPSTEKASNSNISWIEDYDEAAELLGDETYDTLSGLNSPTKKEIFPYSASPKISLELDSSTAEFVVSNTLPSKKNRFSLPSTSSLNDSYEEEFPSDIIDPHSLSNGSLGRRNKSKLRSSLLTLTSKVDEQAEADAGEYDLSVSPVKLFGPLQERVQPSNLMSSIDAFEASFKTDFPESFTLKDSPVTSPTSEIRQLVNCNTTTLNNSLLSNLPYKTSNQEINTVHPVTTEATTDGLSLQPYPRQKKDQKSQDMSVKEATCASFASSKDASPIANSVQDHSARWLMEVKASTGKIKYKSEAKISEVTAQMDSVKLEPSLDDNGSGPSTNDTIRNCSNSNRHLLSNTVNKVLQSEKSSRSNEPVFRQFPRTTSPVKPIKHAASRTNRVDFIDDPYSSHVSDTAPLLRGKTSDQYESPKSTSVIHQARSRYLDAIGHHSPTSPTSNSSSRGRSSITSQVPASNLVTTVSSLNLDRASSDLIVDMSKKEKALDNDHLSFSVKEKEQSAVFFSTTSKISYLNSQNKILGSSSGPFIHQSNYRANSLRSTVTLLEDEGDIPMETNLSPRKIRYGEYSQVLPSGNINQVSLPVAASGSSALLVDSTEGKHQFLKGRSKTFDSGRNDRGTPTHHDLGKQRRHINLSGSGRTIRQVDIEEKTSPIYDMSHRVKE